MKKYRDELKRLGGDDEETSTSTEEAPAAPGTATPPAETPAAAE